MPLTETVAVASWADRVKGRTTKPAVKVPAVKTTDTKRIIKEGHGENLKPKADLNGQVSVLEGKRWLKMQLKSVNCL